MDLLISTTKKEKKQIERFTVMQPGKTLNVCCARGVWRYFVYEKGRRTYLGENQRDLVRDLELKDYCIKLTETLEENLKTYAQAKELIKSCKSPRDVFSSVPKQKRHLIKPYNYQTKKVRVLMEEYGPGSSYDREALIRDYFGTRTRPTKSGYYVRSKAEEAIADEAFDRGLFFLYEKDLTLETSRGSVTVHPDFTFFNCFTESFIYLEHFGKVDSPDYAANNFPRLADYLANGFEINRNLFITMEGENHSFTKREINRVLDRIEEQLSI